MRNFLGYVPCLLVCNYSEETVAYLSSRLLVTLVSMGKNYSFYSGNKECGVVAYSQEVPSP
jgi:hypothetical protein